MQKIYQKNLLGVITEIQNWKHQVEGGVLVLRTLSKDEENRYYGMKNAGNSDNQIWKKLHPERHDLKIYRSKLPDLNLDFDMMVESLTRNQIIELIQRYGRTRLPSLKRMGKAELVELFRVIFQGQHVKIGIA